MISAAVIALCVVSDYIARRLAEGVLKISRNTGAAFGIMSGSPELALWLSGAALAVVLGVIYFVQMRQFTRLGLSLMAGGALSNLLERIFFGYVVDWIPVPFLDLRYNLADVEISLGALLVFIMVNKS